MKEAHKAQDIAGCEAAMNELNTLFQAASQEMYNAQGGAQGPQGGAQANQNNAAQGGNNGKDNVTDVDFEEVK